MTFKRAVLISVFLLFCGSVSFAQNQSYRDSGIEYYRAGSFDKAVNALQAAVSADKNDQVAWVYLGAALLRSGNPRAAVKAFQKGKPGTSGTLEGYEKRLEIIAKPRPNFPDENLQYGMTKTVRVAVELLADGHVGFIFPVAERGDGFTQNSAQAAKRIKFNPAWKDGKPVTTVLIVEYSFTLY